MANQDHLALLKQGVFAWNQWREQHPTVIPDLEGADLREMARHSYGGSRDRINLRGANLHAANLYGTHLQGSDLREADLRHAMLGDSFLTQADLRGAKLHGANLYDADLRWAKCQAADFSHAYLAKISLYEADLSQANFQQANLSAAALNLANLSGADCSEANLTKSSLIQANLRGANLKAANLQEAVLYNARLQDADLRGATLYSTFCSGADFTGANLSGAYLCGTKLTNAILTDVDFTQAHMVMAEIGATNLSRARDLATVIHHGPSTLGVDTLARSRHELPETFLQGVGVSEDLLVLLRETGGKPSDSVSCSICCVAQDQALAAQLLTDLQQHGIRAWMLPMEADRDEPIWMEIRRSTRMDYRLILVASKDSLENRTVLEELKHALGREVQDRRHIVFPLDLDGYLLSEWNYPRQAELLSRPVYDFQGWPNANRIPDMAFERLLVALRSQSTDSVDASDESTERQAEYTLLRYAVKEMPPLSILIDSDEDIEMWFNLPAHGLSPEALERTMTTLFENGDIAVHPLGAEHPVANLERLRSALRRSPSDPGEVLHYRLTQQGGDRWETEARADWSRYAQLGIRTDDVGAIVGASRAACEEWLDYDHDIVPESVQWETLRPWQALYWKVLPVGHRVQFMATRSGWDADLNTDEGYAANRDKEEHRDERQRRRWKRVQWYLDPW